MNIAALVTSSAILISWLSIVLLLSGNSYYSFLAVLTAFMLDTLDGCIARRFGAESNFGRIYDGLADVLIYLVYPALFVFDGFGLKDPLSLLNLGVFLVAGLFRLARFADIGYTVKGDKKAYPGIPVVFSLLNILIIAIVRKAGLPVNFAANTLFFVHSLLMVTKVPFPKPKSSRVLLYISVLFLLIIFYGKNIF